MNFNCIIKTGLVAVAAMVSLSSFSQDLIARQAPIDRNSQCNLPQYGLHGTV